MLDMLDKKRAPDALHVALGQGVADGVDRIKSERATQFPDTAQLVIAQAANGTHSKSEASG